MFLINWLFGIFGENSFLRKFLDEERQRADSWRQMCSDLSDAYDGVIDRSVVLRSRLHDAETALDEAALHLNDSEAAADALRASIRHWDVAVQDRDAIIAEYTLAVTASDKAVDDASKAMGKMTEILDALQDRVATAEARASAAELAVANPSPTMIHGLVTSVMGEFAKLQNAMLDSGFRDLPVPTAVRAVLEQVMAFNPLDVLDAEDVATPPGFVRLFGHQRDDASMQPMQQDDFLPVSRDDTVKVYQARKLETA